MPNDGGLDDAGLLKACEAAGDRAGAAMAAIRIARAQPSAANWTRAIRLREQVAPVAGVVEVCFEALASPDRDRFLYNAAAVACMSASDLPAAEAVARGCLEHTSGSDTTAWRFLTDSLLQQKRVEEAVAAFETCAARTGHLVCQHDIFAAVEAPEARRALVTRLAETCAIPEIGRFVEKFAPELATPLIKATDPPRVIAAGGGVAGELHPAYRGAIGDRGDFVPRNNWPPANLRDLHWPVTLHERRDVRLVLYPNGVFFILDDAGECSEVFTIRPYPGLVRHAASVPEAGAFDELFLAGGRSTPNNFAHWTLDIAPRIAIAAAECPGVVVGLTDRARHGFHQDVLDVFGLGGVAMVDLAPGTYRIGRLHVLSASGPRFIHALQGGNRHFAAPLLERRPAGPVVGGGRRLFLDRPPPQRRTLTNRDEVLDHLRRLDFEIVDLGALSNREQAAMLVQASHVVGIHGAAMANLVFCRPGCRVLEIHSPDYGTVAFGFAALVVGCAYRPVFGSAGLADDLRRLRGPTNDFDMRIGGLKEGIDWLLQG